MKHLKIAIAFTVSVLCLSNTHASTASQDQKLCRALALSGGANKGSYEAGVIYGLSHLLSQEEVSYDVVSGISAGALNAAAIAVWKPEDGKNMSEWLVDMWMNMTNDKVYQMWPNGLQEGLFNQSGILDSEPLLNFVTEIAQSFGKYERKIIVGAVDSNTGKFITFSNDDTAFEDYPLRVVSSASIPFIFPHRHVGDYVLVDGGAAYGTNFVSAIEKCMEIVDDPSKIVMDIIICDNDKIDILPNDTSNAIGNFMRYRTIKNYNKIIRNVAEFQRAYPDINYRYLFIPSKPLATTLQQLSFTPDVIGPMVEIGKEDAQNMIQKGEGHAFLKLNQWLDNQEIREIHTDLANYLHNIE